MKKLLLLSALLIFACSSDDEGNPCVYEPTLSTEAVTDITETSATLNGIIAIVSENCDVAPGEMQGFVYSTNPSPTNDDNIEVVYGTDISTTIDNLMPDTTYYVRVFITNSLGEFYGNEVEFTTLNEINDPLDPLSGRWNLFSKRVDGQILSLSNCEIGSYIDIYPNPTFNGLVFDWGANWFWCNFESEIIERQLGINYISFNNIFEIIDLTSGGQYQYIGNLNQGNLKMYEVLFPPAPQNYVEILDYYEFLKE